LLTIQLVVTDASTALKIKSSYYSLRRTNDNFIVGKGIVAGEYPGTIVLKVRNQAYELVVSCTGYYSKSAYVPFEALSTRLIQVYLVPLSAPSTIRLVLTGIKSQAATYLITMPCRNSGVWSLNAGTCQSVQAPLPPVVYSGCTKATQGKGTIMLEQPECLAQNSANACTQWKEGSSASQQDPAFQTISLVNLSLGDYDIHVRLGPPPVDRSKLEVSIAFQSAKNLSDFVELSSPTVPSDGDSWWWHVGFIRIRPSGVQFLSVNSLSSDPTNDGCRITSNSIIRKLNASQGAEISANLGSGRSIVLNIPPGVWPLSVPSEVTVSLLSDPPKAIPVNSTSTGPMIFLDPSGVTFLPPGVTLQLPVSAQLPTTRLMYPRNPFGIVLAIHRLSKGVWIPLQSTIIADLQDNAVYVSAVTDSFSAYSVLVLPPLATEKVQSNVTSPENSTKTVPEQSTFPMGAVIGGSIGGVCIVLLSAFFLFRHFNSLKGKKRVKEPIPHEHMPHQPRDDYTRNQISTEQKSRIKYSSTPFSPEEGEPLNTDLASLAGNNINMNSANKSDLLDVYMHKHSLDVSRTPSFPPFAIAELVRRGHLLPSRYGN
jgi:hypothetical protein